MNAARDEDVIVKKKEPQGKAGIYAWVVLSFLVLMRVAMNWQRKSLGYIYGF